MNIYNLNYPNHSGLEISRASEIYKVKKLNVVDGNFKATLYVIVSKYNNVASIKKGLKLKNNITMNYNGQCLRHRKLHKFIIKNFLSQSWCSEC